MLRRPASVALVTNAARRVAMQDAHRAAARQLAESFRIYGDDGGGYGAHLRAVLAGYVPTHARRCAVETLHAQAVAWARLALASGARFNVWQKAADALTFSAAHDLASLCVPSKLAGIDQTAAAELAGRMLFAASFRPARRTAGEAGGDAVAVAGVTLGRMQPKHAAWMRALPAARVAVVCVTGGDDATGRDGQTYRRAHGVNVAVEVGALALAAEAAPVAVEVAPAEDRPETAAEIQARLAEWF